MNNEKDVKSTTPKSELPLTDERIARNAAMEKKTFKGRGQEVRK